MKQKRDYTKKNLSYWNNFGSKKTPLFAPSSERDTEPELVGSPLFVSMADYERNGRGTSERGASRRKAKGALSKISSPYSNLESYSVPFYYDNGGVADVKTPIELCQKAYFHVPIFRNTIDVLSELSDADLVLSGGTKASREFVKKWMESAKIEGIKNQFFREYYRSGNIFIYRMFAEFSADDMAAMKTIYAKNYELIPQDSGFPKNSLPLKYVLLNPLDIVNYSSISGTPVYKKILSNFEATRLRNPTTEEEKKLAEDIKKKNGEISMMQDIYMDLEPKRLIYVFYKKQDYEPFGVPFGFPVLRDINWKLELKKIDQSVARSLENIILLITMGNEPDKGGINPKNLEAMKGLFSSEAVGRILVADYTTKAQFVVPQLDNILGEQKYKIVNEDIRMGLQNIFFEDAKYSNSEIKIRVFFEKLKEGKKTFINDFLQPEIKKVCSAIGFRDFPKVRFKSSTILNEVEVQKAATRLLELGVLTPKQGVESINSKELPDHSEIGEGQEEYKNQREQGLYTPLVGGAQLYETAQEVASTSGGHKTGAPVKVPKAGKGRPTSSSIAKGMISIKAVAEVAKALTAFEEFAKKHIKQTKKLKEISEEQDNVIRSLCSSIAESNELKDWEKTFKECSSNMANIDKLNIKPEILELSREFDVDTHGAAMIYHSRKI